MNAFLAFFASGFCVGAFAGVITLIVIALAAAKKKDK